MIRMKQVATKITEYVKKSKREKLYGVFGLIYLIAVIFVMNDAWLYQTPIAILYPLCDISVLTFLYRYIR